MKLSKFPRTLKYKRITQSRSEEKIAILLILSKPSRGKKKKSEKTKIKQKCKTKKKKNPQKTGQIPGPCQRTEKSLAQLAGCKIHRLYLCKGVRSPQWMSCIWYQTIWWWGSISGDLGKVEYPFITISPSSTLTGMVAPDRGLSMGQIEQTMCANK